MFNWTEYKAIRKKYFGENRVEARKSWARYQDFFTMKERNMIMNGSDVVTWTFDANCVAVPCTSSFADCPKTDAAPCKAQMPYVDVPQQEGNNPMNYANVANAAITVPPTEVQDQRKYLEKRLDQLFYAKDEPLYRHFGLDDDAAPYSPVEFKKRIDEGKFQIRGVDFDQEHAARYDHWHWTDLIAWRDPAKKADRDGYDAARKDLREKKQNTLDIIKIDDPKAGLEALKAFEAWEPKGATN